MDQQETQQQETDDLLLRPGWILITAKQIGELRDSVVSSFALLYLFGYIAWSYHAWQANLGILPLVDTQYFMAGVAPAIIALCTIWLYRKGQKRLIAWVKHRFENAERDRQWIWFWILSVVVAAAMIYVRLRAVDQRLDRTISVPDLALSLAMLYVSGMICQLVFVPLSYGNPHILPIVPKWQREGFTTGFMHLYVTLFLPWVLAFCAFAIYLRYLYPGMPQEMGGVKPRFGYIDIKKEDMSRETFQVLVDIKPIKSPPDKKTKGIGVAKGAKQKSVRGQVKNKSQGNQGNTAKAGTIKGEDPKVYRSKKLVVFYTNSDYMIVRPFSPADAKVPFASYTSLKRIFNINRPKPIVYQVRADAVVSVTWSDVGDEGKKSGRLPTS